MPESFANAKASLAQDKADQANAVELKRLQAALVKADQDAEELRASFVRLGDRVLEAEATVARQAAVIRGEAAELIALRAWREEAMGAFRYYINRTRTQMGDGSYAPRQCSICEGDVQYLGGIEAVACACNVARRLLTEGLIVKPLPEPIRGPAPQAPAALAGATPGAGSPIP